MRYRRMAAVASTAAEAQAALADVAARYPLVEPDEATAAKIRAAVAAAQIDLPVSVSP